LINDHSIKFLKFAFFLDVDKNKIKKLFNRDFVSLDVRQNWHH